MSWVHTIVEVKGLSVVLLRLLKNWIVRWYRCHKSIILRLLLLCAKITDSFSCNLPTSILIKHRVLLNNASSAWSATYIPTRIPNHSNRIVPTVILSNIVCLAWASSTSIPLMCVLIDKLMMMRSIGSHRHHSDYLRLLKNHLLLIELLLLILLVSIQVLKQFVSLLLGWSSLLMMQRWLLLGLLGKVVLRHLKLYSIFCKLSHE